jgi:RND family efflux transporter MFP subunit
MTNRTWGLVVAAGVVVIGIAVTTQNLWRPRGAVAQAPRPGAARAIPVEIAKAEMRKVPVRIDAIGVVTPMASVAVKARIETAIIAVHFADGAQVKKGELLFTLDSRQIEAEIKRVQAVIDGAESQLAQAQSDVQRYSELVAKNAATQVTLNNAKTQVNISRATAEANKATLENLKVQLDFTQIRAPISGRISAATIKVGNLVRPADIAPLATINQVSPIYIAFAVPQQDLAQIRQAMAAGTTGVAAAVSTDQEPAIGIVTAIDNTVDAGTGMVPLRATMENARESLWPGMLVNTQLTLRVVDVVAVPSVAVQVGQSGTYVFVVKDNTANVRPVTVARVVDAISVIDKGLAPGEIVVTDGQLLLGNGTKVAPRGDRGPPRGARATGS